MLRGNRLAGFMNSGPMIEVTNRRYADCAFGNFQQRGIAGLLGPNVAGKSTTIGIFSCYLGCYDFKTP